jgi:hypothetical protein
MGLLKFFESSLVSRAILAAAAGTTFGGKRNWNEALGYAPSATLKTADYRERYDRDSMAGRVVDAFPDATWRGTGGEILEDEDPETITKFEQAWMDLAQRLHVWSFFRRADVLAGLGRFSVVLIGAPGDLQSPLTRVSAEQIAFLSTYGEEDVEIKTWENDANNPRFGFPVLYSFKRLTGDSKQVAKDVHWTRVIHVADGLLDDNVFGQPRLKRVWNDLDDLMKVKGGGSEAFWIRANQGLQFDIDKDLKPDPKEKEAMKDEVDEYVNNQRRIIRTRGVTVNTLGSDVADFSNNASTIHASISAGCKVPLRILLGSERGELASTQDRDNWTERVQDRRDDYAGPLVVRQLVDRFILVGALPKPTQYDVHWPAVNDLTDEQKVNIAAKYAEINQKAGETVITANEIRDWALGRDPLDPEDVMDDPNDPNDSNMNDPNDPNATDPLKTAKSKAPRWMVSRKRRALLMNRELLRSMFQ